MWLERFLIIVPGLAHKQLPYSWGSYSPRPTEITIMVATFAAMALLYMLFSKFVPIISIWEMKVGNQPHPAVTVARRGRLAGWRGRAHDRRSTALYDDPDVAQRAVDGLRAAGAADGDIVVMSSEPFEEHEFGQRDQSPRGCTGWPAWAASSA